MALRTWSAESRSLLNLKRIWKHISPNDINPVGRFHLPKTMVEANLMEHMSEALKRRIVTPRLGLGRRKGEGEGEYIKVCLESERDGETYHVEFGHDLKGYHLKEFYPIVEEYGLKKGHYVEFDPKRDLVNDEIVMRFNFTHIREDGDDVTIKDEDDVTVRCKTDRRWRRLDEVGAQRLKDEADVKT
ncbi:hypothetical protein QVD17_35203 [Tagetes erecta]|uniref:Uncharacterized protein n=1 Tax=Tagetes erecta TaxID=13708 RepID=A0AAD8NEZ2_TARER|nr:hypothetical protein QVD17_35203 [Tagetes erecta]